MPPKKGHNKGSEPSGDATQGSSKHLGDSTEQQCAYAWGVPIKRIIEPKDTVLSSTKNDATKQKSSDNEEGRQSQVEYEDEYEDECEEDEPDGDTSSERDWSGAEYEDKIPSGTKVQTVRARPHGYVTSGGMASDIHATSIHIGAMSLQAKKLSKKKPRNKAGNS